ncbi:MAG: RdgB/HAM1 family non-canonical purine NTP pyrophosphatase [Jaaginema sp. PMC 1079.18]|nr:RdgB/HAM1 family non-canonical purine NTP pyrophosphatase [Jaaginema sp. PMC 1080.18]MEC4853646.1 RdgB/HAM1 family non-canonical purine NTP pyrophosphatase [Jaaginema sp. PMC 1079.18]MEC4869062.1 RdgB/HAM1 family non-canonical purine NTP pyrophosphatase [Jaaginema sp. PMC 1078.18]
MNKLIVATGNPGKLAEMQAYLGEYDIELALKPPEIDIAETGTTFAENATLKASQVAKMTKEWAIADDSGLAVDALNGAPGIYSARYGKTDAERIQRLLNELGNTSERTAQFVCALAIANPDGEIIYEAVGICPGEILTQPQGTGGFGYDPIFYVRSQQQTFAQMSPETKHQISHRGRAFAQLLPQLPITND